MAYFAKTVTHMQREKMINWLIKEIGPVMWSRPIVEYMGKGWHVKNNYNGYEVQITDDKDAVLFALKWT